MRSYHKVWTDAAQTNISAEPTSQFDEAKYIRVGFFNKASDYVQLYNFLGSCAFAQISQPNAPHWTSFNSNGTINITFSGQQLAGSVFHLHNYADHPLN